jgi:hypothetical protein
MGVGIKDQGARWARTEWLSSVRGGRVCGASAGGYWLGGVGSSLRGNKKGRASRDRWGRARGTPAVPTDIVRGGVGGG